MELIEVEIPDLPIVDNIVKKSAYMREYMRDYVKYSPKVECECGAVFKSYNRCIHNKTKKHVRWVENIGATADMQTLRKEFHELRKFVTYNFLQLKAN